MRDGVVILNFARGGIVDDAAVVEAIDSGKVYAYVCDFPNNIIKNHPRVISLPHLGGVNPRGRRKLCGDGCGSAQGVSGKR